MKIYSINREYDVHRAIIAAIFGWLSLFTLTFDLHASINPASSNEKKVFEEYFLLLESIEPDSLIDQVSALQGYLESHPDFERVYLKLLECYLIKNEVDEAENYFNELTTKPQYCRNSYWMLAKIFALKSESYTAFEAYKQGLSKGLPSPALLKDFIDFYHNCDKKFSGLSLLTTLNLTPEYQKIVSAINNYKNNNFNRSLQDLSYLRKNSSQDPIILHLWGDCLYKLSSYFDADYLWRSALEISRKNKDIQSEAKFLMNLGVLSHKLNEYDQALNYYNSAYDIASRIGDLYRIQLITGNRGLIYKESGDYHAAKVELEQAIKIASKIGEYGYLANWYSFYGQSLLYLEKYSDALASYDESEKLARNINNKKLLIQMMLNKGDIYFYLKQNILAMKIYQEAHDLAIEENMKDQQYRANVRIANLFFDEGNYSEAKKAYQRFVNFANHQPYSKNTNFYWLWKLAKIYMFEESYERAKSLYLQAYKAAKEADRKRYMAWSLLGVAEIELIAGNIPEALQLYGKVLEVAKSENNLGLLSEVYLGMGNAYSKANELNKVIAAYTQAANVIELSRQNLKVEQFRIGYFSEEYKVYQKLVFCFLQRYEISGQREDLDSLYYYDQMARSRVLQELKLCNESPINRNHTNNSLNGEYRQACKQLRMLQRRLRLEAGTARSADEWDYLLSQLEAARYSLIAQRLRLIEDESKPNIGDHPFIPSLEQIQSYLKQSSQGVLIYHISAQASFVMIIDANNAKVIRLPIDQSMIVVMIDSLMSPLHDVKTGSVKDTPFRASIAHRLYQLLFKPAEEMLVSLKQLLIIPDLALLNLPLEMLLTELPDSSVYTPLNFPSYWDKFLLHRYTFAYSPAISFLIRDSKPLPRNPNFLVFANPFDENQLLSLNQEQFRSRITWRFSPLPFSEREAESIKNMFPSTKIYKRGNATKINFFNEVQKQQILHIATHGFIDLTFDPFSGLLMAVSDDTADDGFLMGYEISELNLGCDLVVLSACETGRGKLVAGEGILGLPRLFLGTGAKTVLMTLWKVDDKFTSELMPLFYDNLINHKRTKAEALTKAKREISLKESSINPHRIYYQHPFYWAAFVLYGDPGTAKKFPILRLEFLIAIISIAILMLIATQFLRYKRRRNSVLYN